MKPAVVALQAGSWTVKGRGWQAHHPATCPLGPGSECVWVRPWRRWSSFSSYPGSCSASASPSHPATVCPVWRESMEWSSSQPSTRWPPHSGQAGTDTRARENSAAGHGILFTSVTQSVVQAKILFTTYWWQWIWVSKLVENIIMSLIVWCDHSDNNITALFTTFSQIHIFIFC